MSLQSFSTDDPDLMRMLSDCYLVSWFFKDQEAEIKFISADDEDFLLHVKTDLILSNRLNKDKHLNNCHIEIIEAESIFSIFNNYYIPPDNFGNLMKLRDFSFFYGRNIEYKYCISFVGYSRLLTFPVRSFLDISYSY